MLELCNWVFIAIKINNNKTMMLILLISYYSIIGMKKPSLSSNNINR